MPRAVRRFLSGYVWHFAHGYHQKTFLRKLTQHRRRYLRWVFEAGHLAGENDALTPDNTISWEKSPEGAGT